MGRTIVVGRGAGWRGGGWAASCERRVLGAEMRQLVGCTLDSIVGDEETLAVDTINEGGPGGHFFAAEQTLERYETEFYAPLVSDWRNYESWEEDGKKTATQRANTIWKQLLDEYEKPPIDQAIEEDLQAYMAHRKEESMGSL